MHPALPAVLLGNSLAVTALPALARVELPPGQAPASAERGGQPVPPAAAKARPACASAYLPLSAFGWARL